MDLNLRQIRSFVAVAHLGSFTRAAEALHLTQPTLTVQIRRLEEALDVRLLDRTTRSVTLTRMGASLLPAFERTLGELDAVIGETRDVAAMRRGTVRIAALPSVAASILPHAIGSFHERFPGAAFVVRDLVADRVLDLVRDSTVDIGITGGTPSGHGLNLAFARSEAFHVVFRRDHPLATRRQVTRDEIVKYPLVALQPSTSVRAAVDEWLREAPRPPIIATEATYMMTVAGMVSAGLGIALLPASAREVLAFPDIVSVPVEAPRLTRKVSIVTLAGRSLPPMSEAFCTHLVEKLRSWTFDAPEPG